jgi:hypothetical protein
MTEGSQFIRFTSCFALTLHHSPSQVHNIDLAVKLHSFTNRAFHCAVIGLIARTPLRNGGPKGNRANKALPLDCNSGPPCANSED